MSTWYLNSGEAWQCISDSFVEAAHGLVVWEAIIVELEEVDELLTLLFNVQKCNLHKLQS